MSHSFRNPIRRRSGVRMTALLLCLILLLSFAGCDQNRNTEPTSKQTDSFPPTGTEPGTAPGTETLPATSETVPVTTETVPPETETVSPLPDDLGGFAVSTSTSEATLVGMQILSSGGNAVDAAAAISFMLSVSEPYSSGIGGGGIMLIYDSKTGETHTIDYYGAAGAAETPADNVAVPGLVAGMDKALKSFGTMSLADTLQPAIDYAEEGFTVSDAFIFRLNYSDSLRQNPAFNGLKVGDVLKQKELAETFRTLQREGADAFYRGSIAEDIAASCGLTKKDLAKYRARQRSVVRSEFAGYQIIGSYGPSSSLTVCQMLKIAEMLDIPSPQTDPNGYLDVLKTATTVAFKSRKYHVVDPGFYKFRPNKYLSESYLQGRIDKLTTAAWEDDNEQYCTTQFSVIDRNGLVVCVTNSLSDSWGSYVCVDGFYLNNTLRNFSSSGKNAYEPKKRPRTHFSPMICVGPDGELLTIGTPGGLEIPKLLTTVLIDILREGEDVQTAVDKGRLYYDSDGSLCIESEDVHDSLIDIDQIDELYYLNSSHLIFGCTSIVGYRPDTGVYAVCDMRRDTSKAMVYHFNQ